MQLQPRGFDSPGAHDQRVSTAENAPRLRVPHSHTPTPCILLAQLLAQQTVTCDAALCLARPIVVLPPALCRKRCHSCHVSSTQSHTCTPRTPFRPLRARSRGSTPTRPHRSRGRRQARLPPCTTGATGATGATGTDNAQERGFSGGRRS
eukprot:40208-Chlamydomonas_euryale.AAC.4